MPGPRGLVSGCLSGLPQWLLDVRPAPPASNRAAWNGLPSGVRTAFLARGLTALEQPWPALPATLWLGFGRSGDRVGFEDAYLARRRHLNALVLAECTEGEGRFLDAVIDGLWLLSEESGWQLPAHNAHVRGGPRAALPDTAAPVIDLFAAETGAQLALIAALLGPALDAVSPEIVRRIDREIAARIVTPYLERHFWWMGQGDEPMNNWTAWCTQNVLLAVFTRPTDQATRHAVMRKAAASLDAFLKDYGEDGACGEGALYYRHAGLCLFNAIAILDAAAPGVFAPLWAEPKLRNIAEYIRNVHVADDRYVNFSDCSAAVGRCGAREYLFARAVGSDALADFAARDWAADEASDLPDEVNLFYRLQTAFAARELAARAAAAKPARPADIFYSSIGLLVARDDRFTLAVKAGDNGGSHNHNDVGSLTLYKDGAPVLIDVGVETYTARTFSARRYEIWTMQSAFHNLPSFGGVMQQDGPGFAARDVETWIGEDETGIGMEIAGAWPEAAGLRSYRRTVRLLKGRGVSVEDRHEGDRPAEMSLMFAALPRIEGDATLLDGLARIDLTGAGAPRIEAIAVDDARLRLSWPERIYRVLVPLAGPRLGMMIS